MSCLLLVVSAILLGVMGFRFLKSGKFMPAGLVASLRLAHILIKHTGSIMQERCSHDVIESFHECLIIKCLTLELFGYYLLDILGLDILGPFHVIIFTVKSIISTHIITWLVVS